MFRKPLIAPSPDIMSDPYADLDIDPAVLADVTRVVQELMMQQQLDQMVAENHPADHEFHNYENDKDQYKAEHADRQDVVVSLLSVRDECVTTAEGSASSSHSSIESSFPEHIPSSASSSSMPSLECSTEAPSSSLSTSSSSTCSSLSSTASGLGLTMPASTSASSNSTCSIHIPSSAKPSSLSSSQSLPTFALQDSALKPESTHLAPPSAATSHHLSGTESGSTDQVLISLLPGQKTPTRATATVKAPATNPDEHDHKFFQHPPADKGHHNNQCGSALTANASGTKLESMEICKTPASSPTTQQPQMTTPKFETIPRAIPASASPPTRPRRKKALLIGINYFGDPNQLLGCINDTRDVFGFLNGYYGFRYQDTVLLTDDQIYEDKRPTGANIRYWMKWLVKDAEPQDSLFFHYAGHGGRIKDFSYNGKVEHLGDEADGYDEIIYPSDYLRSGIISDDEMYDLLVKELPSGVQLTALVDACHSGTMLDLPYVYNGDHVTALEKFPRKKVGAMAAIEAEVQFDMPGSSSHNNNGVTKTQTQTTTTTMTTTTTVTMTTTNGASTHHSPSEGDLGNTSKTDIHVSPHVPDIDCHSTKKLVSPTHANAKRSIGPLDCPDHEDEQQLHQNTDTKMTGQDDVDESVPRLTVTTPQQHESAMSLDQQLPGSSVCSLFPSALSASCSPSSSALALKDLQGKNASCSPTSPKALSPSSSNNSISSQSSDPSRRKRAKSVHTADDDETLLSSAVTSDSASDRGMACDSSAWTQTTTDSAKDGADVPSVASATVDVAVDVGVKSSGLVEPPAQTLSHLVSTPSSASMFAVPDNQRSPGSDNDVEEAKKMALFRETKGNVVMFSGCRDDQASADIRASAKDASIIAHHNKFGPNAVIDHGASADAHLRAESISNPLGYSLPQPYTSPLARGAVSYAWIQCLSQKPEQSYEELLSSMRYFMKQRDLDQVPQLGSGVPMDMRTLFSL
ncbi:Ca(2+)-dependent cysteine protease [Podila humilis]|nr:Ca(2+)-dependent cysteine protease [Podila humilis]